MYAFALNLLALAALTVVPPDQAAPPAGTPEASDSSDLMRALRASDVAEIYIVNRNLAFVIGPRPDMVRIFGCKYRFQRESPQWTDFERALAAAEVRIVPTTASDEVPVPEVRIGLVLSDWKGTVLEIYARYPDQSESMVPGFSQRRQMQISASFVTALESVATRHPELALAPSTPIPACARDNPS